MAKTAKKTRIKGATAADRKVIDAAKASVRADETPEAKTTTTPKRAAAKEQFAKADAAGAPTLDEIRVGLAARGY